MIVKVHSWFTDNVHMILGVVNLTMLSFQFLKDFMIQPFFSFTDFHFIPCWRTKITFTDFCEIQDILSEEIVSIQGLNSYKYNSLYNPLYLPRNMEELHEIQIVKKKLIGSSILVYIVGIAWSTAIISCIKILHSDNYMLIQP